jgi:acyl-CoA dehydrogenase
MAEMRGTADGISAIVLEQAERLFLGIATKEVLAAAERGEWQAAAWRAVEDAGLPLALVPEELGGAGLAPRDTMGLVRLAGYHALPLPLPETMIAAALWATAGGGTLHGVATLAPANADDAILLRRDGALVGHARRVPWGRSVDRLLVFARDEGGAGWLVLISRDTASVASGRNVAHEARDAMNLNGIIVTEDARRPAPPGIPDGLTAHGALIRAHQMVGAMEHCLDHSIAYASERRQFGRPIGRFQAVQHMLAEAAGQFAAAAAAAEMASEAWGGPMFEFAVAVAKARAGEAAGKVAEVAHQVHGAMGFTQEHPLHFSTRRLWSWRDEFGHEPLWQERLGRIVCRDGGEAIWPLLAGG